MKKQATFTLLLIFLFLIAGISIGGYFYYRYAKQNYRSEIDRQLSAIADLKVKEIAEWRGERLSDATIFYKNDLFSDLVQNYFENPHDLVSHKYLCDWLQKIKQHHDYENIFLADIHGINRLSVVNPINPVSLIVSSHVSEIIQSKQITFEDFYRDKTDGQIYLALLVPVIDTRDRSRILGILALQIDPKHYLYPFINTWPTASRTSETLIVRREGNDALFLNEPRFDTTAALALKIPRKRIEVPAVRAAIGWQGGFEGIDYRGVPVIAAVRTIPNSPWAMVAKMDISEAFAPLKKQLLVLAIPSGILLISLFIGMSLALRQRNIRFYKEQFKTAEALRNSESQLFLRDAALTAAANTIVITDLKGQIIWVNPAFTKNTGYTPEEVIGKNPRILKSGKHTDSFYTYLWETISAGRVWQGEIINRYKDGSIHTEEMTITPVLVAHDTIINYIAIKQDLTERKHIEDLVRQSEERYRALIQTSLDGFWVTDLEGHIQEVNEAYCLMTGYSKEMLTRIHISDLEGRESSEETSEHIKKLLALGYDRFESKHRCADGKILDVIISALYLPSQQVILVFVNNITERRQKEEKIKRLQQQTDYILGATKTGMNIIDSAYTLQYVSSEFERIYGACTGRKCYEYFKGLSDVCKECLVKQAFDSKSTVVYESTLPRENDRPIQVTTIPFQDETGNWLAAEVSVDITERKKFEEELTQAKSEAEQANVAKSEFLSRMSHELRTPLNSILGFAQLMDMDELQPRQKKGIDHILSSGQHLLGLINEVLDIARIESGRFALSLESVQLCEVMSETLDIVRPMAEAKHVSIELTEPQVDLQPAWVDRQRLKQILLNLINNAVKYNLEGGSITIECRNAEPEIQPSSHVTHPSSFVKISVTDTGLGITPEKLEKLFIPFERAGAEQTGVEGTGLGLTITKKLVEAMGGVIGVESMPGQGSTFWIEIPMDKGQRTKDEETGNLEYGT